ncbi:hypothetical protein [Moraxella sp. K2450]|uniref:hypothetical protein n=1 Tax=Moraxella sp. K2450 TaxID=2780076 RepID=UPI0018817E45|nr:hypothetical protein [Moraxella sp. K2450]MBE9597144.1 hypothetical protein [Moraxella sp. K2450]
MNKMIQNLKTTNEAIVHRQRGERWMFGTLCHQTSHLLHQHPQGMTLASVQRVIGLSAKTAKAVLSAVAVEKDGKFYYGDRKQRQRQTVYLPIHQFDDKEYLQAVGITHWAYLMANPNEFTDDDMPF